MTSIRLVKLGVALLTSVALFAALPQAASAAPVTPVTTSTNATPAPTEIDYIADVYPSLPSDHVFENATYERLSRLLDLSDGNNYAVILGGAENPSTQAAIKYVDEVAKQYQVPRIYHFDPRLDGDPRGRLDITRTDSGLAATWRQLWTTTNGSGLKDKLKNLDATYDSSSTYVLIYNRGHLNGAGVSAPVVAGVVSKAASFTSEGATGYRAQLSAAFDSVHPEGSTTANISEYPFFDYYRTRINGIAATATADVGIPESAREGFTIQTVTYPELIHLFESKGDFTILFGGTWCPYTTPTANIANTAAKEQGVKKIYQFDFRLDGNSTARHIRDTPNQFAYLYGNLVNKYLPSLVLEPLDNGGLAPVEYYHDGDTTTPKLTAGKIGVPFFLEYDKDNVKDNQPAPVVNEWIGYAPGKQKYFAYAWYQASDVRKYIDDPQYYVRTIGRQVDPDVDSVTKSSDGARSVSLALPALNTFFAATTQNREAHDVWADVPTATPTADESLPSDTGGCGTGSSAIDLDREEPILGQNGNSGYDVNNYNINVVYTEPAGTEIAGGIKATTTVSAQATKELNQIAFDFRKLAISAVSVNGAAATYSQTEDLATDTHKLVVNAPVTLAQGSDFTVVVSYRTPTNSYLFNGDYLQGLVSSANSSGATGIGEPNGASFWYPSNLNTTDKATYDITLTAPNNLTGVSIGKLISKEVRGTITTRTWREDKGAVPYTVFASFGDYVEFESNVTLTDGTVIPAWSYVDKTLYEQTPSIQARIYTFAKNLQQYVRWSESVAGKYPFSSIGFVFEGLSDGTNTLTSNLETQGRPFFPGVPSEQTFIHELLHQWFGNSVSIAGWEDLWLNEGIVTFLSNYYLETVGRADGTTSQWYSDWFATNDDTLFWALAPADPLNTKNLFGNGVYARGSYATAALRVLLGDADFLAALKTWTTQKAGSSVSTADFVANAQTVGDVDLTEFPQAWLYEAKRPATFPTEGAAQVERSSRGANRSS